MRFPDIHHQHIVFTYAGDLYTVSSEGGLAKRLTSHEGFEMFARFSPDGKTIAFTGQYDGNTEVYVVPANGGSPKRLTYTATLDRDFVWDRMGPNNIVMAWTPDGKNIVFRSRMRSFNSFIGQLFSVKLKGDIPTVLPLPKGGFCSFSADGKKLAYNQIFREFRTWKRYHGGMADDISIYDFDTKQTTQITQHKGQDIIPMWHENRIYFISDRNKTMNLFCYDLETQKLQQLTDFNEFDIKFPSIGPKAIVFENGGYLYRFDLDNHQYKQIPIYIKGDFSHSRPQYKNVNEYITGYSLAPDGNRVLFNARGEIFSAPQKHGPTRNLTQSSGIHERSCVWSPDGKWIAYISDEKGEDHIYIAPTKDISLTNILVNKADTYKYSLSWSPDSKKIMWGDKKLRLRYVDIDTKKITEVTQNKRWEIRDYSWSPDSKWITFSQDVDAGQQVYLYSLDKRSLRAATSKWYNARGPVFSDDGKYLFFVSQRNFSPTYSQTEWNHSYQDMDSLYFTILSKDTASPFIPKSDEVTIVDDAVEKTSKKGDNKKETIRIDDGLETRTLSLNITRGGYYNISVVNNHIYYIRKSNLCVYNLSTQKEIVLGEARNYQISARKKHMLVSHKGNYYVIPLPKGGKLALKKPLNLSQMKMTLNRKEEWRQIYRECWRQMRDFFYAPNMHGVDWDKIYDRYLPLVAHVNHRADLSYIIGEVIGELNVGHAYVGAGDMPKPQKIYTGLLGAELERDASTSYYRIRRILKGQNWNSKLRSPLEAMGVNAKVNDYILAVNGVATTDMDNIYHHLLDTAGKQVVLRINSKPQEKGSREVTVIPVANEEHLYYYNWVHDNIEKVEKLGKGQVGYIHIPDMGVEGLNQFVRYFYPQLKKKALLIDVRGNGGGNVSPMIIERLRRKLVMVNMARNIMPGTNPGGMHLGPKICLMNEHSASDGDIFPYRFKKHGLGKLVGKRSWGGVVGIRGSLPLSDGGYLFKPEFAPYSSDGKKWLIEGHGVDPDVIIANDPALEFSGKDQQLEKAVEILLDELKTQSQSLPKIPAYPDKN
ncbi:S41 family peptidase [Candidatus Uabimicrobium amorphum]|uniref:Tricorn protease homolog n=1 Tax=Uabimicrobium amorphum TaxID=2596890 RepID=A0A5S9F5R7_UABAM|nr:S41 family peptidase [Candidatus Uabimicrobium amorphum]BBM86403.1 Tricorn protease homolog [Candidatus Uabimicrobium amorphum]